MKYYYKDRLKLLQNTCEYKTKNNNIFDATQNHLRTCFAGHQSRTVQSNIAERVKNQ